MTAFAMVMVIEGMEGEDATAVWEEFTSDYVVAPDECLFVGDPWEVTHDNEARVMDGTSGWDTGQLIDAWWQKQEDERGTARIVDVAPSGKSLPGLIEQIVAVLDGEEWSADTAPAIAELLAAAGYVIREPREEP